MKPLKTLAASATALVCLTSVSVHAMQADIQAQFDELKSIIKAQNARIAALEGQLKNKQAQQPAVAQSTQKPSIKLRGASPEFDFGNGTKFNIHGRIQSDYAVFNEDRSSGADLPNQGDIRRLFLGVRGMIAHDWAHSFFIDFSNDADIVDAWLAYQGIDNLSLKVGNQIELFSFEQHVSNLNQSFIERSAVLDAFHP